MSWWVMGQQMGQFFFLMPYFSASSCACAAFASRIRSASSRRASSSSRDRTSLLAPLVNTAAPDEEAAADVGRGSMGSVTLGGSYCTHAHTDSTANPA